MVAKTAGRKAERRSGQRDRRTAAVDHDEREHMLEFRFSTATVRALDAAAAGLDERQQERFHAAIDRVIHDVGDKVGRAIVSNVIDNANELLALLAPGFAAAGRWSELAALRLFLDNLDVPIDHARVGKAISKAHGSKLAKEYAGKVKVPRRKAARR